MAYFFGWSKAYAKGRDGAKDETGADAPKRTLEERAAYIEECRRKAVEAGKRRERARLRKGGRNAL